MRLALAGALATLLAISFTRLFETHYIAIASAGPLLTAAGLMTMLAISRSGTADYYGAIALDIVAIHTLFRFPHFWAMALSGIVIVAFVPVAAVTRVSEPLLIANKVVFLVSATIVAGFASWALERYARVSFLDRRALETERERSERLLLNVLPEPIAERLKADEQPIADEHPEASVLFADLVGFSTQAATREPAEIVEELNRVFTSFDRIVEDEGIEKIKTIGDGYMAVAGVPLGQDDHVERIARAALAMREAVGEPYGLRVGIATGRVVAGVIGERKFTYDLWGDTVNAASRMESTGEAGRIQVSESVASALGDAFDLEERGEIEVKGLGPMRTWWLEAETPA